jgi:hypothetical protein
MNVKPLLNLLKLENSTQYKYHVLVAIVRNWMLLMRYQLVSYFPDVASLCYETTEIFLISFNFFILLDIIYVTTNLVTSL